MCRKISTLRDRPSSDPVHTVATNQTISPLFSSYRHRKCFAAVESCHEPAICMLQRLSMQLAWLAAKQADAFTCSYESWKGR